MCVSQADIKLGQLSWEGGREEGRKGGGRRGGAVAEHIAIIWTDCGRAPECGSMLCLLPGCKVHSDLLW